MGEITKRKNPVILSGDKGSAHQLSQEVPGLNSISTLNVYGNSESMSG